MPRQCSKPRQAHQQHDSAEGLAGKPGERSDPRHFFVQVCLNSFRGDRARNAANVAANFLKKHAPEYPNFVMLVSEPKEEILHVRIREENHWASLWLRPIEMPAFEAPLPYFSLGSRGYLARAFLVTLLN